MSIRRFALAMVMGGTATALSVPVSAQGTWRVSVDSSGVEADSHSSSPSVSGDGRFVAFDSKAGNLVQGDVSGYADVFLHDRQLGITTRLSVDPAGFGGVGPSVGASISESGRFVAFSSFAWNLVPGDNNSFSDVFVRDRWSGTTTRVSVDSSGAEANSWSGDASISADGRYVAFASDATNLVAGDTNWFDDIFVHDRQTGMTTRVSVDSSGVEGDAGSFHPSISGDGQVVAFDSDARNLVPNDLNRVCDVFVHDRQTGTTSRASVDSSGVEGDWWSIEPSVSSDGRFVAFESTARNLVAGDTNLLSDVFVRDRQTGTTTRVSVHSTGDQGNGRSKSTAISRDGRMVTFLSHASNLVSGDTNDLRDIFLHDRQTGTSRRVSVDAMGVETDAWSDSPSLSGDGRLVAFASLASNLVPGDTNGVADVFVHGSYLTLEASPELVSAGATLTFTTWTGQPSGLAMLAAVDVNGAPVFVKVLLGSFDAAGLWTLAGPVPPGLAGSVVTFLAFGMEPTGKVGLTNLEAVTFQ